MREMRPKEQISGGTILIQMVVAEAKRHAIGYPELIFPVRKSDIVSEIVMY